MSKKIEKLEDLLDDNHPVVFRSKVMAGMLNGSIDWTLGCKIRNLPEQTLTRLLSEIEADSPKQV